MRRTTRIGALIAATGLASAALWAPTATAEISEPFGGSAASEFLHANVHAGALSADAPEVLDLGLSDTTADADSPDGLDGGDTTTHASGTNLSLALGGEELPQLVETIEQSAPPDNSEPNTGSLIPLSEASPLLTGDVLPSTALARDPMAISCPSDGGRTTVSEGTSAVTDLGVLDLAELAGDDTLGPLVSATDIEGDGTLETTSGLYIGPNGEVISESTTPAVQLSIAGQVDVEVLDPVLTATATGTPGGASVDYSAQVRLADEVIAEGEENSVNVNPLRDVITQLDDQALDQIFGPLDENVLTPLQEGLAELPLFDGDETFTATELIDEGVVELEQLAQFIDPTVHVRVNEVTRDVADDGTSASGSTEGVVVDLTLVNTLTETETELLSVNLGAMSASANVAEGGIDCGGLPPLGVEKDVSDDVVQPGEEFTYTIDVTNPTGCEITDVVVTDEISGTADFEVIDTDPQADTVDGGTVTWNVGSMDVGGDASFTITVQTQEGSTGSLSDIATADGNCDDQALPRGEDSLDGPNVEDVSDTQRQNRVDVTADTSMPRTGGGGLAILGLGAIALASRLRGRS